MTIAKMLCKLVPAVVLSVAASSASASVVIDYSMDINGTFNAFGQFSGVDSDANGFLNLDELSALSFVLPAGNYNFGRADLSHFGSYDIAQNLWNHDADGWDQTGFAYISFFDGDLSVNTENATNVTTAPGVATEVPEPASLALLGLGLLGIAGARRRVK